MGKFEVGHQKKGGRKKGSISNRVKIGREFMEHIASNPSLRKRFLSEMKKLEGKQFIDSMVSIMEFSVPKFNKIDAKQVQIPNVTINLIAAKPRDNSQIIESTRQTIDITHEEINSDNSKDPETSRLQESN